LKIASYLKSRAVKGPWRIEGCSGEGFAGAVVIPSLAESATLPATLSSLAANPPDTLQKVLVLVVVNHRPDAPLTDREDNRATLELLISGDPRWTGLNLAWVDAASPGLELPLKGGGVGLARRIGLDLTLTRLDIIAADPLLICLDGDTVVRSDYLPAIIAHFQSSRAGAAAIPYEHQRGSTPQAERLIARYELFLRGYILGLELAGSPYGFHSVGSAMACRASAYCAIGGMNNRQAGEDFYFMQQLFRTVGVEQVTGTIVHPSPRPSHRVPFGTGRSVQRMGAGGEQEQLFYHPVCFRILKEWLTLVDQAADEDGTTLLERSVTLSPYLSEYLQLNRFVEVWDKLRRNHPTRTALMTAFHGWFDGLKTMKLIHHLSADPYPRCEPDEALTELFAWRGVEQFVGIEARLEALRRLQNGTDHISSP
jgi:hypothetical protein